MDDTWQYVFCLSEQGRRTVASILKLEYKSIPRATIDFKSRHTLIISDVIDYLNMEGEVEVPILNNKGKVILIADAVCRNTKGDIFYVEVDLSNNTLDDKMRSYKKVNPKNIIFATHRTKVVERVFRSFGNRLKIIDIDRL